MKCYILSLEEVDYLESLKLQERLIDLRQRGKIEDTLVLLEHPHCLTRGTTMRGMPTNAMIRVPLEDLERLGVKVYDTDRGGYITYHGPGQLIAYPIIDLSRRRADKIGYMTGFERLIEDKEKAEKINYMAALQEVMVRTVKNNDIDALTRREDRSFSSYAGAWYLDGGVFYKIGAIGIKIEAKKSMRITKHGLALNVNTDLSKFNLIDQCGFKDVEAISMEKIFGKPADTKKVRGYLSLNFMNLFGYEEAEEFKLEELLAL